jgi:hypothetical protein
MGQNKRNIVTGDVAKPSDGNALSTGTGTHACNRREEEAETRDNSAAGRVGRKAGDDKANPPNT